MIRTLFPILIAGWLVLLPPSVLSAEAEEAAGTAWAQARARALWQHEVWLNLGHYKPGHRTGSWRSHADDPAFFLSAQGREDPRAELQATLSAFAEPAQSGDEHAQCRFVARLVWLRSELDLGELPQPDCTAYREFRQQVQALSLIHI